MVYKRLGFTYAKFKGLFREIDSGVKIYKKSAYATLSYLYLK